MATRAYYLTSVYPAISPLIYSWSGQNTAGDTKRKVTTEILCRSSNHISFPMCRIHSLIYSLSSRRRFCREYTRPSLVQTFGGTALHQRSPVEPRAFRRDHRFSGGGRQLDRRLE